MTAYNRVGLTATHIEYLALTSLSTTPVSGVPNLSAQQGTILHPGRPNPFGPATTLSFSLARGGDVSLKVFSPDGRLVRTLVDGQQPPGEHAVWWNGTNNGGTDVASGVYVALLRADDRIQTQKVMLVK